MPVSILLQNAAARRPSILPEAKSRRRADSFRPRNEMGQGSRQSSAFAGGQVRLPVDQLKSYLAEKLAY